MALAEKPKSRPSDEPSPDKKVKALDKMGFAPLSPPRRIVIQEDRSEEPLTRWKKPDRR